jgi:carbonic anhydrase
MPFDDTFADVVAGNAAYADNVSVAALPARASSGLAVVTCMDPRIDPLAMLSLRAGDAVVLRNAGARVTDDVVHALVPAVHLLDVRRLMVIAHTKCRMAGITSAELHDAIVAAGGSEETRRVPLTTAPDQLAALEADVQYARSSPLLAGVTVAGFRYDLDTGRLHRLC